MSHLPTLIADLALILMSASIIDLLKVIQVHHKKCIYLLLVLHIMYIFFYFSLETSAVQHIGQRILSDGSAAMSLLYL